MENGIRITLKAARVNAGLSQKTVADHLGVSVATIVNWEHHPDKLKVANREALSRMYNIPIKCISF